MPSALYQNWSKQGRSHRVLGHELFVVEAGARDQSPLVLLHGFPSASVDFHRALPALAASRHVIAHDHLGFGLSAKPAGHAYSIIEQADLAVALWQQLGLREVDVLAHDYGVSVATELLWRHNNRQLPLNLRSVTLVNSGLIYRMAHIKLVQHMLRLAWLRPLSRHLILRPSYLRSMRSLFADPDSVSAEELETLWQMTCHQGGQRVLADISQYLEERRLHFRERWEQALQEYQGPAHLLWGDRDPVGIPRVAEFVHSLMPQAKLTWLEGVGHYPMLEAPERFSSAALQFLEKLPVTKK
ncbi:MAG: alpha/beta fold hydrolase [Moraxellaceae bacterium]